MPESAAIAFICNVVFVSMHCILCVVRSFYHHVMYVIILITSVARLEADDTHNGGLEKSSADHAANVYSNTVLTISSLIGQFQN